MVQEIIGKVTPSTKSMKQDMKKSFAEIMKEQNAHSGNSVPITKNIIKEALNEGKQELDNFNERKKRLIIFDAEEPVSTDSTIAKNEDYTLFKNVCNSIDNEILEDDSEIVNIRRIMYKKLMICLNLYCKMVLVLAFLRKKLLLLQTVSHSGCLLMP